jgi:hypothetical protein
MSEPVHNSLGHETEDADVRAIVLTGAGLAIAAALVIVMVYGIFRFLAAHPATTARGNPMAETERQHPPAPRIEEHPDIELKDLRSQEDHILTNYGWMDRNAGVVRVPIERAMELQLQRGFPTRNEVAKK